MEGFKGTRGPWVASKTDRSIGPISKDDDQSYGMILPVAWVEFDGKPGHHQANANLIAAAPELLEALQTVKQEVGHFLMHQAPELLSEIDTAIAKAMGH